MTSKTATPAKRGQSNNVKGAAWMRACVRALRSAGWPGAEIVTSHHRSDITGCGSIGVECKDEQDWRHLAEHISQASTDAQERDLPVYVVWRKRRGHLDPMEGWCVQRARDFWAERKRMEELEAVELEYSRLLGRIAAREAARAREENR